jgi:hypothetical protein
LCQVKKLCTHLNWLASRIPIHRGEFAVVTVGAEYLLHAMDLSESSGKGAVRFTG